MEVKFKTSQPKGAGSIDIFPDELQGTYVNQDGDTLEVSGKYFTLVNRKSKCDRLFERDSLSQMMLLKPWHDKYVLNVFEDSLWTAVLLEKTDTKILNVMLIDAEDEEIVGSISSITIMDTLFTDDGEIIHYVIDPDEPALLQMVEENLFSDQYFFKKIDF
jgi:hypothetical protein